MDIGDMARLYRRLYPCDNCQKKCNDIFTKWKCCSFGKWKSDDRDCDRLCGSCDKTTNRQRPIDDAKQNNLVKSWCIISGQNKGHD